MMDQAQGLRSGGATRVIAVTSGKGGVGKTNFAVNMALSLVALGRPVALLDTDLGMANVDVLLGIVPRHNLGHLQRGEASLDQVTYRHPSGLAVLPGASGLTSLMDLGRTEIQSLVEALVRLERRYDFVLLDTGAGIGRQVRHLLEAAGEVWLVVTPEPTSLTDAYAVLKSLDGGGRPVRLVVNRCRSAREGEAIAAHLKEVVNRFLGRKLHFLGSLPEDPAVGQAVRGQTPYVLSRPGSKVAAATRRLAGEVAGMPHPDGGGIGSFVTRLARLAAKA